MDTFHQLILLKKHVLKMAWLSSGKSRKSAVMTALDGPESWDCYHLILVSPAIESRAIFCYTVPFNTNEIIRDTVQLMCQFIFVCVMQGLLGIDFCFLSRNAVFVLVWYVSSLMLLMECCHRNMNFMSAYIAEWHDVLLHCL